MGGLKTTGSRKRDGIRMRIKMSFAGDGIRNMGYGIWDIGYGISDMGRG